MKKLWLLSLTTVLALGSLYLVFEAGSAKADPNEATKDVLVNTYVSGEISIALDGTTDPVTLVKAGVAGDYIDGMTGGIVTGSTTWRVRTSNLAGFSVNLKAIDYAAGHAGAMTRIIDGDDRLNLVYDMDSNARFEPYAAPTAPTAWENDDVLAGTSRFGYAVSAADKIEDVPQLRKGDCSTAGDTLSVCWSGLDTSANGVILSSVNETAMAGDLVTVAWKAQMSPDDAYFLKDGEYRTYVLATALNNL